VAEVVAVEPEPYLRRQAARVQGSVPSYVLGATAAALPILDSSIDAVVFSLVLCSVESPHDALIEAVRVLVPGGELRFFEHVRSIDERQARRQDRADHFWPLLAGGCHCNRDTAAAIDAAGFVVASSRRFDVKAGGVSTPVTPHVIGKATAPIR
jgi:SAM-dependent methyltransferase